MYVEKQKVAWMQKRLLRPCMSTQKQHRMDRLLLRRDQDEIRHSDVNNSVKIPFMQTFCTGRKWQSHIFKTYFTNKRLTVNQENKNEKIS